MQSALWKTAALISVMGVGGFVVVKVHHELQRQQQDLAAKTPADFPPVEETNDESETAGDLGTEGFTALGPESRFDALPFEQSEPANDEGGHEFGVADGHQHPPQFDEAGANGASNQFFTAGPRQREYEPAVIDPPEFESDPGNPFGRPNPAVAETDGPRPPAAAVTADARFAAGPRGNVAQVAGAQAAATDSFDPFAGPGIAADTEEPADTGNSDEELVLPEQTSEFGSFDDAAMPVEPEPLPELTFGPSEPEAAGNPFGALPPEMEDGAPQTADEAFNPFDVAAGAEESPDSVPVLDLGDPALSDSDLALPESDLALPEDNSSFGGLPSASIPAERTDELTPAFPAESESAGGLEPEWPDSVEPGEEPALDAFPANSREPSRFPATRDDDAAPAATIRTPGLSPIPSPAANPLPDIRPVNPDVKPRSPRPEFVGDGTLDVDAPSGPQQPELTIQKLAPPNATVGEPLVYAIKIKNIGKSTAHAVVVEDKIPLGTTLQGSIPQAELVDKKLTWRYEGIEPGHEETIRIKVVPDEAGEVGSVATVRFVAEVAATTRITTPKLSLDVQGPGEVAVGEKTAFQFRITNSGDGEARNVYIRNLLPEGLQHPGGKDIEYDVGTLKPGESRAVELSVTAMEVGQHALRAQLNSGTTTRDESSTPVNVIKSRLLIQRQGPKRRFVGRPADYETIVSNRSTRPLQRIEVVEKLPEGMELAAAPEGGRFDSERRTITWQIAELAPGAGMKLKTSVIANRQGMLHGAVTAVDAAGNQAQLKSELEVAGFASLKVDLEHNGLPVGVGEPVAMQLRVKNRGTSPAEHVEALFDIPDHLEFVNAEGPVTFEQQGRTVRFAAIDTLPAEAEQTFKIMLTAAAPGSTPVMAQLSTSDLEGPLQQAEAVIVEADNP